MRNGAGSVAPAPLGLFYSERTQAKTPTLRRSVNLHFDLAGFCCFLLGKGDGQHAVLVFGRDFVCFDGRRDGKAADEIAVAALDTVVALHVLVLDELPGTFE